MNQSLAKSAFSVLSKVMGLRSGNSSLQSYNGLQPSQMEILALIFAVVPIMMSSNSRIMEPRTFHQVYLHLIFQVFSGTNFLMPGCSC